MFDFINILTNSIQCDLLTYLYGSFAFLGVMLLTKKMIME